MSVGNLSPLGFFFSLLFLLFSCFVLIYQKSVYIIEFTCVHTIEAGEMEWMCAAHTFMNDCSGDQLADSRRSFVIAVIC